MYGRERKKGLMERRKYEKEKVQKGNKESIDGQGKVCMEGKLRKD